MLLIAILAGSLMIVSLLSAGGVIQEVSRELIQSKVKTTEQRLQAFFDPIRDNLELLRTIGEMTETVEFENTTKLNRFFAALTARLASLSPAALRLGKEAIYTMCEMEEGAALVYLREAIVLASRTEDAQEGIRAFFEKREPVWTGR